MKYFEEGRVATLIKFKGKLAGEVVLIAFSCCGK
jgi:hypothetical protein